MYIAGHLQAHNAVECCDSSRISTSLHGEHRTGRQVGARAGDAHSAGTKAEQIRRGAGRQGQAARQTESTSKHGGRGEQQQRQHEPRRRR
jgi:hypothetical protein